MERRKEEAGQKTEERKGGNNDMDRKKEGARYSEEHGKKGVRICQGGIQSEQERRNRMKKRT